MKNRRIHQGQVIGTGEKVFNAGMAILGIVISLVVLYPIYYVLIASLSQPYYVENGDVMFAIRKPLRRAASGWPTETPFFTRLPALW